MSCPPSYRSEFLLRTVTAALTTITKRSDSSVAAKEGGVLSAGVPPAGPPQSPQPEPVSLPKWLCGIQGGLWGLKGGQESTSSIISDQQREQTDSETDRHRGSTVCRGDAVTWTKGRQSPSDPQQSAFPTCTFYVTKNHFYALNN